MSLFSITCETCQARLTVTSKRAIGQILSCPKCQSMVHVVPPPGDLNSGLAAGGIGPNLAAASTAPPQPIPSSPVNKCPVLDDTVASGKDIQTPSDVDAALPEPPLASSPPPLPESASWASSAEAPGRKVAVLIAIGGLAAVLVVSTLWTWSSVGPENARLPAVDPVTRDPTASSTNPESPAPQVPDSSPSPPMVPPVEPTERTADTLRPVEAVSPRGSATSELAEVTARVDREAPNRAVAAPRSADRVRPEEGLAESKDDEIDKDDPDKIEPVAGPALSGEQVGPATATATFVRLAPPVPHVGLPDISRRLEVRIPHIEFRGTPLVSFLDDVGDISGVPISLDPVSFAGAGVSLYAPISATVDEITAASLLENILGKMGLRHTVRGSHVDIRVDESNVERVEFAVDDLCRGFKPAEQARELANMIQQFVAPATWKTAGEDGLVGARGTTLRITQVPSVQLQVHQFLNQLRVARGLTIELERPSGRPMTGGPGPLTEQALSKPISITFADWTTVEQVRESWQRISGLTILVDWQSLGDQGISPMSRIRCAVIDRPVHEALSSTLQPLRLSWIAVEDGAVQIIGQNQALAIRQTAVYDVSKFALPDGSRFVSSRAMIDALVRRVTTTLGRPAADAMACRVDTQSGHLIVSAPQAVHRRLDQWLQ